jgi:hypothetical protein
MGDGRKIDERGLNEAVRLMQTAGSIGGYWRRETERLAALTFWRAVGFAGAHGQTQNLAVVAMPNRQVR